MHANQSLRLGIVDDDDGARSAVARLLRCLGHEVRPFESAEAIEAADVAGLALDCLIVDVRLPGVSGPELRDRLRGRGMLTPVVFITGDAGVRIRDAAHAVDGRQAFRRRNAAGGGRRRDLGGPRFGRPSCSLTTATGAPRRQAASASGTGISPRARSTSIPSSSRFSATRIGEIRQSHRRLGPASCIPTTAPPSSARAQAHIAGETPLYEFEHRMVHRDGSIRWFLARGSVTRDAAGVAVSMAGTDTDITGRKRGEEALRQAEELNRRIAEHTGDCVKILDLEGRLIYMNREGLRFLEVDAAARAQPPAGRLLQRGHARRGRRRRRRGARRRVRPFSGPAADRRQVRSGGGTSP